MRVFEISEFIHVREEDVLTPANSVLDGSVEDKDAAMEGESSGMEERGHVLSIEGKLLVLMRESNENCLSVGVPGRCPLVCIPNDSL